MGNGAIRECPDSVGPIRLRIRAVWSGPSLSVDRINEFCRIYRCIKRPLSACVAQQDGLDLHCSYNLEDPLSYAMDSLND